MTTRSASIDRFLAASGWPGAQRAPLSGDASFRHYERVRHEGRQAVLMDAPPDREDVRPFCHVAEFLVGAGFSAPRLLARDDAQGFLLLEDLGDALYSRHLSVQSGEEAVLYTHAIDVLAALHRIAPPALPAYDEARLVTELEIFADWYLPRVFADPASLTRAREEFLTAWRDVLRSLPAGRVAVLRDYHADNLIWLPERDGVRRVGLLDFQDALIGHPAYDLVSLLEDARRDVSPATVEAMIARYLDAAKVPEPEAFRAAYAVLGAQRNCKIVGIFHRLARRDGKEQYLRFLPRVWGHLEGDLTHPALAGVREWFDRAIPPAQRREAA